MAEKKNDRDRGSFGRLLRFWRTSFGISQDSLAWDVGVSSRHIGFLEVGRSQPTRDMVRNLAEVFHLSQRDTNSLLAAAGFTPKAPVILDSFEQNFLQESQVTILRNHDPHPTIVMDPYTNIQMLNKAFLSLLYDCMDPAFITPSLNGYRLLLSEWGFRPHIQHWEEYACIFLMVLQQEVLLNEDPIARNLLDELLAIPHLPKNWQRRAAEFRATKLPFKNSFTLRHGYQMTLCIKGKEWRNYLATITTMGSSPSLRPRSLIYTLYPEDGNPYITAEELAENTSLKHPLLFY